MTEVTPDIFAKNYHEYCRRLAEMDLLSLTEIIGGRLISQDEGVNEILLSLYDKQYRVSENGTIDSDGKKADYISSIILFKYLLLCPEKTFSDNTWTAFRDFKKTSHFTNINYFKSDVETPITTTFSGRKDALLEVGLGIGGENYDTKLRYDVIIKFTALPRISLLLLFNDGDEEFDADCSVLYQNHAEEYLDPESLAMTGALLAKKLISGLASI